MLEDLNERSEAAERQRQEEQDEYDQEDFKLAQREAAHARWQRLKQSRALAMHRLRITKRLSSSSSNASSLKDLEEEEEEEEIEPGKQKFKLNHCSYISFNANSYIFQLMTCFCPLLCL